MTKALPYLEKILEHAAPALAFVLPLFFLPLTTEFYETAKTSLLLLASSLLFVVWALKMLADKKVSMVRSPLDLPLWLLLAVVILVTAFSPNFYAALTGSYLRFQPSLAFALALITLYYIFSSNVKRPATRELASLAFVVSVSFLSLLSLLSYLGLFETVPGLPLWLKSRAFNPVGSLSTLSVLAAAALPLALGLGGDDKGYKFYIRGMAPYLLVAVIALLRSPAGLLTGGLALLIVLEQEARGKRPEASSDGLRSGLPAGRHGLTAGQAGIRAIQKLLPLAVLGGLILALGNTPEVAKSLRLDNAPRELTLSSGDSWQIATQVLSNFPLFGAGLGTYPQLFTLYKPLTYNASPIWNLRFDRPASDVFLWLSEAGVVGLAALLFFLWRALQTAREARGQRQEASKNNPSPLTSSLCSAILVLMVGFLVSSSSSLTYFFLFFFLALLVSEQAETGNKLFERVILTLAALRERLEARGKRPVAGGDWPVTSSQWPVASIDSGILPGVLLVGSFLTGIFTLTLTSLIYGADFYNRQALAAVARNDGRVAYESALRATQINPHLDVYQRNLAQISLGVAVNLASRPELSEEERQTVRALIQEAINRVRLTTEIVSPGSVSNWETRAQIYSSLINVAQNAETWAVDAYSRAISLDPLNPNLRLLLGGIYFGQNLFEPASRAFSQAVSLKPDLANAHYNLAQALIKLNRKTEALTQYDITLNLVGTAAPDYEKAKKERDDLAKEIREEELAKAPSSEGFEGQEPLKVSLPERNIQKENVAPPPLELGRPNEASPSGAR